MPKGNGKPISKVEIKKIYSISELLFILKNRFDTNSDRHSNIKWIDVESKLLKSKEKLDVLNNMESSGGEPDVIGIDKLGYVFADCSVQSPSRRSICYDSDGEEKRINKGIYPGGNAIDICNQIGASLMNEEEYRILQSVGEFDTKSSSWIATSKSVRDLGGAEFGDRRFDKVYIFHNGAESFYSDRGCRCILRV